MQDVGSVGEGHPGPCDSVSVGADGRLCLVLPFPTARGVRWDTSADGLIIRYWKSDREPGAYAVTSIIAPLQVWGDGRVIWLSGGTVNLDRELMVGWLTENHIPDLLQGVIDAGFFDWEDRYLDPAPLPGVILVVQLASEQDEPKQVFVQPDHGPDAFDQLVEHLLQVPDTIDDPKPYVPDRAHLQGAMVVGSKADKDTLRWPGSDGELEQVGGGVYLEGETLRAVWALANRCPRCPIGVQADEELYLVTLSVPGVSLCTGRWHPFFDVGYVCE